MSHSTINEPLGLLATFLAISLFAPASVSAAITPSLVSARASGVAPLAVFFDASGTRDATIQRPFHDLEYTWNFGDASAGAWAAGAQPGLSKNIAVGPVAAHVFETPGTYKVNLRIFNGTDAATASTTITVADPDAVFSGANTICFSISGNPEAFTGCPAAAKKITTSNFATALSTYQGTRKRLLFRRGETFTAATSAQIDATGPGIVGAFGGGAAPVVQMTGNDTILNLSGRRTPNISDWRIMDLEFDGLGQPRSVGISTMGGINQLTILRMHMHDIKDGILVNEFVLDFANKPDNRGHRIFDGIAIADSTLTPIIGSTAGWRIFASAKHLSIIGNTLGNIFDNTSMASHTIRAPYINKGVISNNIIARAGVTALAIKLHGPAWCDATSPAGVCLDGAGQSAKPTANYSYLTNTPPIGVAGMDNGGYTEKVVISDNQIIGAGSPYLVDIGPQSNFRDERVRDVIVERNFFKAGAANAAIGQATQSALVIMGYEITARNNICDLTGGGSERYCVNVKPYGATPSTSPAPFPNNVWIYNNTAYSGDKTVANQNSFATVRVELGASNVTVKNNLGYAPLAFVHGTGSPNLARLIDDAAACGAACITASNNSTAAQVKNVFPGWVNVPLPPAVRAVVPADFRLAASSYARDAGASGVLAVPVFSDFFLTPRPQSGVPGVIDMGAIEGP